MHDQSLEVYQRYWKKALYLRKTYLNIGKINKTLPLKKINALAYFPRSYLQDNANNQKVIQFKCCSVFPSKFNAEDVVDISNA